jgi:ABC-type amino acid transport substrate-binding protein
MDKKLAILALLLCTSLLIGLRPALAQKKVDIVIAGVLQHGPMQPTIQAIKDVTSKYGDQVNVTWVDMDTQEGQKYMSEHGLAAHMNILIDGKYQYAINGKNVTFQWFEGQQWTRGDLDAVISDVLNGTGQAVATTQDSANANGYLSLILPVIAIAGIASVAGYIIYRKKARKG